MFSSVDKLRAYIPVSRDVEHVIENVGRVYPWRITDYYASLIDPHDPDCPIRIQSVPSIHELEEDYGEDDPLEEGLNSPVSGVIRVYPDRIAVVVTNRCPVYCRHCLRKRLDRGSGGDLTGERRRKVIEYIRNDKSIRDVLLTGGDPLMLADDDIEDFLGELRGIGHVEIIRIGSRVPVTWPERITGRLLEILNRHQPLWFSTQFNHPREITTQSAEAIAGLIDSGIPVNNQSVLLKGVNDSPEVMLELVRRLVGMRVRPYYVYQAQTLRGTGHFVTTIEKGRQIIGSLRGWTTGFAVPHYVLDTPGGKVPLDPEYLVGRDGDYMIVRTFRGREWREYNPLTTDRMRNSE